MRIVIASSLAVVLWTALVFLVSVPQETLSLGTITPLAVAKGAIAVLEPIISSYTDYLRSKKEAETIKIRVWMHNGDAKLNGCGFYFSVNGYSGGSAHDWFPAREWHMCGKDRYEIRMTAQSTMYEKKIHLGNEQTKQIELHADGWHNTFVHVLCIGLNERTIAGGPRAFCINNDLLKGCKGLTNKWNDTNLEWNDMLFTRTNRGAHKIIFHDVEKLIGGFESLDRNPKNTKAVRTVCNRINLIRGTDPDNMQLCPARNVWVRPGGGISYVPEVRYKKEDKNPYGCIRNRNKMD